MMTMRAVNLDTFGLSLLTAKEDIINPRSSTNWALFTYDGITNKLKLADSGAGGVVELAAKFHIAKPQYGLCRLGSAETGGPRIALISWVGPNVDEYRRTECASHIPAIRNFFKEAQVFIIAEKAEDVTEEKIGAELTKFQARAPLERFRRSSRSVEKEESVGTNYRKTNAAMEMRRINRDSFWARAEREEEERKEEERRRAGEERRRLERERVLKERREAEERDRKMNEKLQRIEEERRKQAEKEEELHQEERFKWEQQEKEHVDDMRARLRRSESIEKAAEAAALVSQRSMNPREFFRQLSSSSQSPSSPGSPRTVKPPFRRYQRSLTDTAFNFTRSDDSTSPLSPTLISPFSRAPPSPFYHTMSPPTSPNFRPITSPQRPRAPMMSPPTSPQRSGLTGILPTSPSAQAPVQPKSPPPTQPSAPPASPSLLASLSPSLPQESLSQPQLEALLPSPPVTPPQSQAQTQILPPSPPVTPPQHQPELPPSPPVCLEPAPVLQGPTAPLPESPQQSTDLYTATRMQTELVSEAAYTVQAVLVEEEEVVEDEEKEEKVEEKEAERAEDKPDPEPQPSADTTELIQTVEEQEEAGSKQETEPASVEKPVEIVQEEEETEGDGQEDQLDACQAPAEPVMVELSEEDEEPAVTEAEAIHQQIKQEIMIPSTNGFGNAKDIQNGIVRSMSPSDTDPSSPELAVCYDLHGGRDEDYVAEEQEISENGQEVIPETQMCVRALYDYQAEDESEISFEPGDIISDVETVDKSWWRGYSKDGRQGLFPANYVETL